MANDRRHFLKSSSLALAGVGLGSLMSIEPLAAEKRRIGANDKIRVAAIGINGMGWTDLTSIMKIPEVQIVALCDVDENVLNFRKYDLAKQGIKTTTYTDYRKLLENKDIDAVIIGTPDHWHCLQMVEAVQAGKDVYVEKPCGNSIAEVNVMVAAQQRYNKVVQVGQWQRSQPHMVDALNYVHSGKLDKIRTVKAWAYMGWMKSIEPKPDGPAPDGVHYDMWLGPATKRPFNPNRFHFSFRWFWDYAGGLMTDWGVHLIDYAMMGMDAKTPTSVIAAGGKLAYPNGPEETPDTLTAIYEYDGYNMIWEQAQGISNGNYGRDHGIAYIGDNGTLILDRNGWEVRGDEKRMESIPMQYNKGNGVDLHTQNFVNVIRSRKMSDLHCSIHDAANVATVCQMGNISYRTGGKITWDAAKGRFNEEKANAYLSARYNNGYQLPKV